jgi:hypothetical protein
MTPSISIADSSFAEISGQAIGIHGVEVSVHQHEEAKFVLMTVEGYQQLRQLAYDDSDLTPEEMLAAASQVLAGPNDEDWNSEQMRDYDNLEAHPQS